MILNGLVVPAPFIGIGLVLFNFDPCYFIAEEIIYVLSSSSENGFTLAIKLLKVFLFIMRLIFNTFIVTIVTKEGFSFPLLLDCYRIQTYDFCVSTMTTVRSTFSIHRLYIQFQLFHSIFRNFFDSLYCAVMGFSQVTIVVYLKISIDTFGKIPMVMWITFPQIAVESAFFAFAYLSMCCGIHDLAGTVLTKNEQRKKLNEHGNKGQLKMTLRCLKPLRMHCGPFFQIQRKTLFMSLHLAMSNVANLILI